MAFRGKLSRAFYRNTTFNAQPVGAFGATGKLRVRFGAFYLLRLA
jgi:hypothetical protein